MNNTQIVLKWKKNIFGRWQTYYKGRIIEVDDENNYRVNGVSTNNSNIWTVVNFINDDCYKVG